MVDAGDRGRSPCLEGGMNRKVKEQVPCVICGKNMRGSNMGEVYPGWTYDMKFGMTKKNSEWFKKQLGVFDFLLEPDVDEVHVCMECHLKAFGMTPDRVKAILGGTFR